MKNVKQIAIKINDVKDLCVLTDNYFKIISIHVDNLETDLIKVVVEIDSLEDLYYLSEDIFEDRQTPFLEEKETYDLSIEWISQDYNLEEKYSKVICDKATKGEGMDYDVELLASSCKEILLLAKKEN